MAFLQPAIAALRSGDADKLAYFDDLLFSEEYRDLRKQLGANEVQSKTSHVEEFDNFHSGNRAPGRTRRQANKSTGRAKEPFDGELPMEDPLVMEGKS
jgi:hypothetical protein